LAGDSDAHGSLACRFAVSCRARRPFFLNRVTPFKIPHDEVIEIGFRIEI
jgi:hypothetical protein